VIPENSTFPDCPKHPKLTTIWKPIVDDNVCRRFSRVRPPHLVQLLHRYHRLPNLTLLQGKT
jgi:hypothetical protein